jgi:hypothetical protein
MPGVLSCKRVLSCALIGCKYPPCIQVPAKLVTIPELPCLPTVQIHVWSAHTQLHIAEVHVYTNPPYELLIRSDWG